MSRNVRNEDSDQTARMRRLIWIFLGRTCPKVLLWCGWYPCKMQCVNMYLRGHSGERLSPKSAWVVYSGHWLSAYRIRIIGYQWAVKATDRRRHAKPKCPWWVNVKSDEQSCPAVIYLKPLEPQLVYLLFLPLIAIFQAFEICMDFKNRLERHFKRKHVIVG